MMRNAITPKRWTPDVIILRADKRSRALIDRAAKTLGKSRTEFILAAACREATTVLLDQRFFVLDDETHERFYAALDKPVMGNRRLRQLLATRAAWEQ